MATPLPQQRLGNSWCILPDASWRGHDITPSGAGRRLLLPDACELCGVFDLAQVVDSREYRGDRSEHFRSPATFCGRNTLQPDNPHRRRRDRLGALCSAHTGKPGSVTADRLVPLDVYGDRPLRRAESRDGLSPPDHIGFATLFGSSQLNAQVQLLLRSFRYDWSIGLLIFGIHLILLGYLIYRSGYIPQILGALLVLDGMSWVVSSLQPYLYTNLDLGFFFPISFLELLLPVWLLIRGWKIREVTTAES